MTEGSPPNEDGRRLQRSDWLAAARIALVTAGYSKVKIDILAKTLAVTRGSFYWHFANRAELLDSLIADWEINNSAAIFAALEQPGSPAQRFRQLGRVWLDERGYSPAYDSAVRDWARVSPAVQSAVKRVDEARIAAFEALFKAADYPPEEAFIRARITYFHQVGYYAMGVQEDTAVREHYLELYISVLLGRAH
jgi:AcrR family transcriptional regulator